jgi:hypothetical protein
MKSTVTFKQFYEETTAGGAFGGNVGGFNPENNIINSTDFPAKDDARLTFKTPGVLTRDGLKRKRKRKRKTNFKRKQRKNTAL